MRAEDREPWDQWWDGPGRRELTKTCHARGYDERYVLPVVTALRRGATAPELERLLGQLRGQAGDPPDIKADGECAIALALWWDLTRHQRQRFGI
jgi:hypothetical protein